MKKSVPGIYAEPLFAEVVEFLFVSVDTTAIEFNAACKVCHGKMAHFTRVGKSRMPEKTVNRPS